MARLSIRMDAAMEQALAALMANGRSKTETVRHALLRTHREGLIDQADADDRAEILAIQRYTGIAE